MLKNPRVIHKRREAITSLPLYHSGSLLKKGSKEKQKRKRKIYDFQDFKCFFGELRGSTLFLYNNDTQDTYTEKMDLEMVKSTELDSPSKKKVPAVVTLHLPNEEVHIKMDNADTGEEWKGYILTVVKKEIPQDILMLPGQMIKLEEMLIQEKKRNPQMERPALPPRPGFLQPKSNEMPICFFNVTRKEAEKMLEENPENGNIILRPSTMPKNYALTLRQKTERGSDLKNYRVTSTSSGFVIELENPMTVRTLDDVLKYFLEKTQYRLRPYIVSQPYDTRIVMTPPPKCVSIPSPLVPKAQVAPMQRSRSKDKVLPPTPKCDEGEYVMPDDYPLDEQMMKQAQVTGELQAVLEMRQGNIYVEAGMDDDSTYQNGQEDFIH